jgi:cyclopropane fatty-acyl-phospholipid synthase-like methyltransferase
MEAAWSKQYDRLARIFAKALGKGTQEIAEIGCGSGQLTIPLAKQASNLRFVLIDTFANTGTGSYSNRRYQALVSNLKKSKLFRRVRIVTADYMEWIKKQDYEIYDAIISSEFLPEITSAEIRPFIRECYCMLMVRTHTQNDGSNSVARTISTTHTRVQITMPAPLYPQSPHGDHANSNANA